MYNCLGNLELDSSSNHCVTVDRFHLHVNYALIIVLKGVTVAGKARAYQGTVLRSFQLLHCGNLDSLLSEPVNLVL